MNLEYYKNKTILVTGASGYIGANLVNSLASVECNIMRSSRNPAALPCVDATAEISDIPFDPEQWAKDLAGVDIIFYLAAQTSTYAANEAPVVDLHSNVLPLLQLLACCQEHGYSPVLVFSGTATQVGVTNEVPVAENLFEKPATIYDIHKLTCEKYLAYYSGIDVIKACTLRLSNVYGPGGKSSSKDRGILNMMIQKALHNETLTIYGEGDRIRDYLFIDDVVEAFLVAAASINATNKRYFNIGSGKGYSFTDIFSRIVELAKTASGSTSDIVHVDEPEDLSIIERRNYVADIAAFTQATGWQPQVDIDTGISKTMNYIMEMNAGD